MPDGEPRWEAADLVAALDRGIAQRLLAAHPVRGWCRSCRSTAPHTSTRFVKIAARSVWAPRAGR